MADDNDDLPTRCSFHLKGRADIQRHPEIQCDNTQHSLFCITPHNVDRASIVDSLLMLLFSSNDAFYSLLDILTHNVSREITRVAVAGENASTHKHAGPAIVVGSPNIRSRIVSYGVHSSAMVGLL